MWGWIGHNPAKLATAPSVEKADVQPPQAEDAARLLSAANAESPELGLFLRLAVVLGARQGEICGLRWPDIDLERGEVLIAGNVVRVAKQALVHKDTKPANASAPASTAAARTGAPSARNSAASARGPSGPAPASATNGDRTSTTAIVSSANGQRPSATSGDDLARIRCIIAALVRKAAA
jgi:hypothetical protein